MADEGFDEDIFDDLYDEEPAPNPEPAAPVQTIEHVPSTEALASEVVPDNAAINVNTKAEAKEDPLGDEDAYMDDSTYNDNGSRRPRASGGISVKEDG